MPTLRGHSATLAQIGVLSSATTIGGVGRSRLFRLRMRPGRALIGFGSDEAREGSAAAGDEIVVSEEIAASLIRHRAAEIIEVIDEANHQRKADTPTELG
jgi:hypothetical protein